MMVTALALSLNVEAEKVYKWVDEHGNTHYGDAVPPTASGAQEIRASATPAVDPSVNTRKERTELLLESFQQERTEKRDPREAVAEKLKKRQTNCERAERRRPDI